MASGASLFTLRVLIGAGVTAAVDSLAFFEGEEEEVGLAFIGVRTPVAEFSGMAARRKDDLSRSREARGRLARNKRDATMSLL